MVTSGPSALGVTNHLNVEVNVGGEQGTYWVASMPLWKLFMFHVRGFTDVNKLFESVVTNTIYYGVAFILYITNVWTPSLLGIALLFGIGNAFDSIVSFVVYMYLIRGK